MKKTILIAAMFLVFASWVEAGQRVRGYWKDSKGYGVKDTYVSPHYKSERNNSVWDNYSTKGNVNPYTGKRGTVDPYKKLYQSPYRGYYR